jgi:hypothetical protein
MSSERTSPEGTIPERMTKEQMVAEFGAPGVENPKVMDLIRLDPASGNVVLVMFERRSWGLGPHQFKEIEEKINRYMGYVLDGFLAEQYPKYVGKNVEIVLECAEPPPPEVQPFIDAATNAARAYGLEFSAVVVPNASQ